MAEKISAEDKKWKARSDVQTMIEYEKLMSDKGRRGSALKEAKTMAKEAMEAAKLTQKVAKKKGKK